MWKNIKKSLNLPESYISITLGFLVVIIGGLLLYNSVIKKGQNNPETQQPTTFEEQKIEQSTSLPTTHTVALKETLWSIAQKYYNSGYNWKTIAQENKINNPNIIEVGQTLNIPKADTILPENAATSSTATGPEKNYTVVKGDNLWKIAVSNYGDGYAWTKIAKANNLINPGLIHPGNVLKLP